MTETNWRSQSLPDSFKVINKNTGVTYICVRDSEASYKVSWPNGTEGKVFNVVYAESTLKEIIHKDKAWVIMENAKVTHHKDLLGKHWMLCDGVNATSKQAGVSLTDIQQFCKKHSAEITFAYIQDKPHYDVFFGDGSVVQAESDEHLVEIMKAIRVLYGKK